MSSSHEFGKGGVNIIIDVDMMSIVWIEPGLAPEKVALSSATLKASFGSAPKI